LHMKRFILVSLALMLLFPICMSAAPPRVDPETHVIRLLHIGKAWYQAYAPGPIFVQDPKIDWHAVPAHVWSMGEIAYKYMRMYLPRTRDRLLNNYDVVLIDGMEALDLRLQFQHWLVDGVETQGLNFVMADDSSSFGTSGSHTSWYVVPVGDILPVWDRPVGGSPYGPEESFHVIPVIPDHEFTRNIPWNEVWLYAANRPWPKEGSIVVTKMSGENPINRNKVQMVYWDYPTGGGRSVAWIHRWCGGGDFWRWKYHFDVVANVIYYTARVPIPQDLALIHRIREMLQSFYYKKVYALSTMEFADKFGANLRPLDEKLASVGEGKAEADRLYVEQQYQECSQSLQTLIVELEDIVQEAIRAKEKAMVWVFVIEWLAVSGTSMLAGGLLWTLMVRRRLYKEVGETKLRMVR